jgi:hypothetical protein
MLNMATVQSQLGLPVLILKEGTKENKGREAQKNNIAAAKQVVDMVKVNSVISMTFLYRISTICQIYFDLITCDL